MSFLGTALAMVVLMAPAVTPIDYFLDCNQVAPKPNVTCNDTAIYKGCEVFSIGPGSGWNQTQKRTDRCPLPPSAPLILLPKCPKDKQNMDLIFYIFSKEYPDGEVLTPDAMKRHFKNRHFLKFIVHGHNHPPIHFGSDDWTIDMKDYIIGYLTKKPNQTIPKSHSSALGRNTVGNIQSSVNTVVRSLPSASKVVNIQNAVNTVTGSDPSASKDDIVVIIVDWSKGARVKNIGEPDFPYLDYRQAVANTRTVAASITKILIDSNSSYGVSYNNMHFIGYDLGAHVSGIAGKEVLRLTSNKIGRISGLEPNRVHFKAVNKHARLDKDDAVFVDIYHTSERGMDKNIGHVDFWINAAGSQPECSYEIELDCDHKRAREYYQYSVTGQCHNNLGKNCKMGYYAAKEYCVGEMYPVTQLWPPYCAALPSGGVLNGTSEYSK